MEHSPKLLDQVRDAVRLKHYSIRTETAYVDWVKRFILFHDKRHPKDMGPAEITAFLTHLAVNENVAASTQNQALSAILFLYREVLQQELDALPDIVRAKQPQHLPVVLTKDEVQSILRQMSGDHQLTAKLLYGSGLRLMECVRLRVKLVLSLPKETWILPNTRLVLSLSKYRRPPKQRDERPGHHVARPTARTASGASGASQTTAPERLGKGLWGRLFTFCSGAQISECA